MVGDGTVVSASEERPAEAFDDVAIWIRTCSMQSLFVTGTDTEVGKTVVTGGLVRLLLDEEIDVGAYKPVETDWDPAEDGLFTDVSFLARALRITDPDERARLVSFTYKEPLAPLVAARREERPVDIDKIVRDYRALTRVHEVVLVEGAGGLSVPLTASADMAGLAELLNLPLLIVARSRLGTLNHTFLTVQYARARSLPVAGVVVNGYREGTDSVAERTNPAMMEEMCEVPVLGCVPYRSGINSPEEASRLLRQELDMELLTERLSTITRNA